MKLKIFVIKKQQLLWAAVIIAIVIISAILLIGFGTQNTINTIGTNNLIQVDVDNDGKNDSIVINADEGTGAYTVNVIFKDGKSCTLDADPTIKTLGYYKKWWHMNVDVKDINNDGLNEIILQSSDDNGPVLHIFRYNNGNMERMASGRYSIYGVTKLPDDKKEVIVLGTRRNNDIIMKYFTVNSGKLVPYTAPTSLNLGKETLYSLLSFVEKEDMEASNINMDSKYVSRIHKGTYTDCSLYEAKYTKYNIPTECVYILRTCTNVEDEKSAMNYKIKMQLTKYDAEKPEYRITSIDEFKNE
jgi:hypothetical protein